jgi:predicted ATPase/DNA-binding SARP family transcriptional activator
MEFRVLGPLEFVVDGALVVLTAPRQRALVAALLCRAGEVVSVDSLIEALWGEEAPSSAASVLRLYVSNVRRRLPPGRLLTRAPGYVLIVEDGELDAERFEALLSQARHSREAADLRLARSELDRALALWRGPAFCDAGADSFARDAAARLDELRLQCIEDSLSLELERGHHREVIPELEALVATHPLRDSSRGVLMLALYRAGRQADALACYRAGRDLLVEEHGLNPSAQLRELEGLILREDPSLDLAPPSDAQREHHRVATPLTATVGREQEITDICRRVLSPTGRLVTLIGPGGVGKTRLAIESAALIGKELADGALLVELAPLRDPELLLASIGHALGVPDPGGSPWLTAIAGHLRDTELLLVLDNLEHLTDAVPALVQLLAAVPQLRILATSRTILRLSGEQVVVVAPLPQSAAATLLTQQTIAAGCPPQILEEDPETLEMICDRLDGLPLAIELAAPWLRILPPADLLKRLDSRLGGLHGAARDVAPRHRTLRATIDWSVELLSQEDKRLFQQLSVFTGGFTLDAVAALTGPERAIEGLDRLVTASLVHVRGDRYELLEVVREYAAEQLGDDTETRQRHAEHFASLVAAAEPQLGGAAQTQWLERLDTEHNNLRTALDWLAGSENQEGPELRLAAGLGRFWYVRGFIAEGLARLRHAIDRATGEDDAALAKAQRSASALAVIQGDYLAAYEYASRSLATYRSLRDRAGAARALSNLGAILHAQGDLELAAATLEECITECADLHDDRLLALAQNNRGDVALSQRDYDGARAHFEQSLSILRRLGDSANIARSVYNLGVVAVVQDRLADAQELLAESVTAAAQLGDHEDVAWCLIALANIASRTDQPHTAARTLGYATALLARIGATMKPFEAGLHDQTLLVLGDALGGAGVEALLHEGTQLNLEAVLQSAVEGSRASAQMTPTRRATRTSTA